jgi:hypothetical protein
MKKHQKLFYLIKRQKTSPSLLLGLIISFTLFFPSCETTKKEEIILGKWQVDSIMSYYKGEKHFRKPALDERAMVGTIYNPRISDFNEFGERVEYSLNSYQNRTISFYDFVDNYTKIKFTHGKKGDKLYNEPNWQIDKLESDQFQYSIIYDMFSNRSVYRFYLSKITPKTYSQKSLHGKWLVKYAIDYITGEEIGIDSTMRQVLEFSTNNFKLYYDNDNDYEMNKHYKVKGDSLLIEDHIDYYIFECDENNLVLMHNSGKILFGDFSGVTSYFVKVAKRIK